MVRGQQAASTNGLEVPGVIKYQSGPATFLGRLLFLRHVARLGNIPSWWGFSWDKTTLSTICMAERRGEANCEGVCERHTPGSACF